MEFLKQARDEVELKGPEGKYDTRKLNSYPSKVCTCDFACFLYFVCMCSRPLPAPPYIFFARWYVSEISSLLLVIFFSAAVHASAMLYRVPVAIFRN